MNLPFKPHVLALICSAGLLAAAGTLYVKSRAPDEPAPAATVAVPATTPVPTSAPEAKTTYTPAQINQWVAPIALYPDALLSQVLMASTYPANVVQAVQWSKDHPSLQGDAAIQGVAAQPWDASVKSLVAFPPLMAMMGQDPVWVENLGNAFLAQPQDVMNAVQQLRALAQQTGSLKSTPQQTVTSVPRTAVAPASTSAPAAQSTTQKSAPSSSTVIKIEPTNPQVVYVPSYNPSTVYGSWPTPAYPPVYIPPSPGEEFTSSLVKGFGYSLGVATTYALFSDIDWDDDDDHHHHDHDDYHGGGDYNRNGDNNININVDNFNHITGQNLRGENARWQHNPAYRNQVPYPNNTLANQFHQTNVSGGLSATQTPATRDSQRQAAMDKLSQGGIKTPTQPIAAAPKDGQRQAASKQLQHIAQRDNYRGYDTPQASTQREASKAQMQQRLNNSTPEQRKEKVQQRSPEQRQEAVQQRRSTTTPEQRQQRQEHVRQRATTRTSTSNANVFSGNESRGPSWQQQAQRGQQSRNVVRNTNREAVRERASGQREFHRR